MAVDIAGIAGIATATTLIVVQPRHPRPRLLEPNFIVGILVLGRVHRERRHGAWSLECTCQ